ncbi:WD domain, G-beta repeat [Bremerella volcania]|uniref:WD domain, G-beta repeat n=1 Tax=Bremerella volcania TaxID=2527984 RepID=A0A518CCC7_9BACT|nr:WD40 repeat domain-containing protein [Bremerella volcania]QDU76871.1 WD domain, G-beta repeat [Bremerella volcania]
MIISQQEWLELYARYRERLLLGPVGPLSDVADEHECNRADPPNLRWARRGELVPFLRWEGEDAGDPVDYPARSVCATRLIGQATDPDRLEIEGLLGIEHEYSLLHSALAVLAFASEAIITNDHEPVDLAVRILRALRRLGSITKGYGEPDALPAMGWGYMLRADTVDDSTANAQGDLTANYCNWLGDPDTARPLEPSAGDYAGLVATLVFARRTLARGEGVYDDLISEIDERVQAINRFLGAARYRIRRSDGSDVVSGPFAFGTALPLAQLTAEIKNTNAEDELADFHVDQLAGFIREFDGGFDRASLVAQILTDVAARIAANVLREACVVLSEETVRVLRIQFPKVWLRDVILRIRHDVDTFLAGNLRDYLATQLDAWLDGPSLSSDSTLSLATALWERLGRRSFDATSLSPRVCKIDIRLANVVGDHNLVFPSQTITIQITDTYSFDVEIPDVPIDVGGERLHLTLTPNALVHEVSDGRASPESSNVQVFRLADGSAALRLSVEGVGGAPCLAFSPTAENVLASGHDDGIVRIRDIETGGDLHSVDCAGGAIRSITFSPDGVLVAAGTDAGHILVFRADGGGNEVSLVGHPGGTLCLAWREVPEDEATRPLLLSGGRDRHIRSWDIDAEVEEKGWEAHAADIMALRVLVPGIATSAFSVVSASANGNVRVWDYESTDVSREPVSIDSTIASCGFVEVPDYRAQVSTVQITADDSDTAYTISIDGQDVSTAGSGTGVNDTASSLMQALEASTIPAFTEITWAVSGDTVTGVGNTVGQAFNAVSSAAGGAGTIGPVTTIVPPIDRDRRLGILCILAHDDALSFWNLENGVRFAGIRPKPDVAVTSVASSPNAKYAVVGLNDGTSQILEVPHFQSTLVDQFNRDDTGPGLQWRQETGSSETSRGRLAASSGEGLLLFRQPITGSNYSCEVIVRNDWEDDSHEGYATQGVIVRATGGPPQYASYYEATISIGRSYSRVHLWRIDAGTRAEVTSVPYLVEVGRDHTIRVVATLRQVVVIVDDEEVIVFDDDAPIGLSEPTRCGLTWLRDDDGPSIAVDDFLISLPVVADQNTTLQVDPIEATAVSVPSNGDSAWFAVARPQPAPAYPWRIVAAATSGLRGPILDALSVAHREQDAMLLALAHSFLGVNSQSDEFAETIELLSNAPTEFPHHGVAGGWDCDFRWAIRPNIEDTLSKAGSLGNGLDFLTATAIVAAADSNSSNREAFRRALLLDP